MPHDVLVKQDAELDDTINLIVARINTDWNTPYIAALCQKYDAADPDRLAFLARLQDYVFRNVSYVMDEWPDEKVYAPTTTIINGEGDCKKMTVLIGSVLRYLQIPFCIKHVFYHDQPFTHVYIIVPWPCAKGYVTLDPVQNRHFDNEVSYKSANVYDPTGKKMNLYTGTRNGMQMTRNFADGSSAILNDLSAISGVGCPPTGAAPDVLRSILLDDSMISGTMGKKQKKSKEERKEQRKKILNKFEKVGLQPARTAFLALVHVNAVKLAKHLVKAWQKDPARVTKFWESLGGDINALKKEMIHGSKQEIKGTGAIAIAALLATATPVIIAAQKLIKDLKVANTEEEEQLDDAVDEGEKKASLPSTTHTTFQNVQNAVLSTTPLTKEHPNGSSNSSSNSGDQPVASGDIVGTIQSWSELFYYLWRGGFYAGVFATVLSFIPGIAIIANAVTLYYLFVHQKFFINQVRKFKLKFTTR